MRSQPDSTSYNLGPCCTGCSCTNSCPPPSSDDDDDRSTKKNKDTGGGSSCIINGEVREQYECDMKKNAEDWWDPDADKKKEHESNEVIAHRKDGKGGSCPTCVFDDATGTWYENEADKKAGKPLFTIDK